MAGLFNITQGMVATLNPDAGVGQPEAAEVELSTSIDIIDEAGYGIGQLQSFNDTQNRPTALIKHISSVDAGRTIEQAPSPGTVTLNVTGFQLYNKTEDGSLIQRLGASSTKKAMKMLEEQKRGFSILVVERHPATNRVVDAVLYQDCWLNSFSKPISIATATIAETASITVSRAKRPSNWQSL